MSSFLGRDPDWWFVRFDRSDSSTLAPWLSLAIAFVGLAAWLVLA